MNKQQGLKKKKGNICVVIQEPKQLFSFPGQIYVTAVLWRVTQQPHKQLFEAASIVCDKVNVKALLQQDSDVLSSLCLTAIAFQRYQ